MSTIKETFKESVAFFTGAIIRFATSKDVKAIAWYAFAQCVSSVGALAIEQMTAWSANSVITIGVGFIIARITKRLNKNAK